MCGEKIRLDSFYRNFQGSPPHVRGKVFGDNLIIMLLRITPACAGKRLERKGKDHEKEDHPRMCGEKRCF